jgi:F0F1-type ATP synthase membrane subunit c/vacuolar-type H+-ATPase subunit K
MYRLSIVISACTQSNAAAKTAGATLEQASLEPEKFGARVLTSGPKKINLAAKLFLLKV